VGEEWDITVDPRINALDLLYVLAHEHKWTRPMIRDLLKRALIHARHITP